MKRPYFDWRILFFYPLSVALALVLPIALLTGQADLSGWRLVAYPAVAAAVALLLWRSAREGIYCGPGGVRVRRVVGRRIDLPWDAVAGIDDGRSGPLPRYAIGFRTTGGELVRSSVQWAGGVTGWSISPLLSERSYDALVDRLRAAHAGR